MSLLRRLRVAPLLLAFPLFVPPLLGAPHEARRSPELARPRFEGFLAEAWARVSRVWEKEGSSTDPFGIPKPSTSASPSGQGTAAVSPK